MTTAEQISLGSLVVSSISAFVAASALALTHRSGRRNSEKAADAVAKAELANRIASGASELSIQTSISNARKNINELALRINELVQGRKPAEMTVGEKRQLEGMGTINHSNVEDLLNVYDLACGLYLDKKIDQERFKRQYHEEIRRLFADKTEIVRELLLTPATTFRALTKVYNEWHNLEK